MEEEAVRCDEIPPEG